jgi:methionyl-tRNA synthetase
MTQAAGDYLIVPMQPTPNGRLHLGHASGPYLRADVLARSLRRFGHRVSVVSGSDVYENWVLLDSVANGRAPEQTCRHFHRLIAEDLAHLGVKLDAYVNPLDPEHARPYKEIHEAVMARLAANGRLRRVREWFPVSSGSGRYLVGVWLIGRCPHCGASAAGNACEDCGHHFQPSEIREPRSRLDEGPVAWRQQTCWFLQPEAIDPVVRALDACEVQDDITAVARRYVEQTGGRIRLTMPGSWGLKGRYCEPDTVICNTFYAYSLYCGAVAARRRRQSVNPFAASSGVTTIGLFGLDNAIAGLVGPIATALSHGALRPFDHVSVNHFLSLHGQKFSTSRRHGIWVSDLIARTSVTADEVRLYLARCGPEEGPSDFDARRFLTDTNRLRRILATRVAPALAQLAADGDRVGDPSLARRLDDALGRQRQALAPARLSLAGGVAVLDAWLADEEMARADPARWLTGTALLGEPFMPGLAGELWSALGGRGRPAIGAPLRSGEAGRPVRMPSAALGEAELRPHVHVAEPA